MTTETPEAGHTGRQSIKTTVIFPIAITGPFQAEEAEDRTVGEVRAEAMTHFQVAEDSQHAYYLTHDGKREPDDATIGSIAGRAEAIKFTLVKELIQG